MCEIHWLFVNVNVDVKMLMLFLLVIGRYRTLLAKGYCGQ